MSAAVFQVIHSSAVSSVIFGCFIFLFVFNGKEETLNFKKGS